MKYQVNFEAVMKLSKGGTLMSWFTFEKEDGRKYKNFLDIVNPLGILKYSEQYEINPRDLATIYELFDNYIPQFDYHEEIKFSSEEEKEKHVKWLDDGIDKYTEYIESYKQQKEAEAGNEGLYNLIGFINEHGYKPRRMKISDMHKHFEHARNIVQGLDVICNKYTIAHAIKWIKKLGYTEYVDKEKNVAYYEFKVLGECMKDYVYFTYEVTKNEDGEYELIFYYRFVPFKEDKLYTHMWMGQNKKYCKKLDKDGSYTYRPDF